jgi:ribonuclease R
VEYLSHRLGEEFEGIISGVRKFGLFVMLSDSLAEGLVSADDLPEDSYRYDPTTMSLTGRHHRRKFGFGDPVVVQVAKVDTAARRVDFILVDAPAAGRKKASNEGDARAARREERSDRGRRGRRTSRTAESRQKGPRRR